MRPTGIWMPLYVNDYIADTEHLSTEEHGAYLLLLMAYWRRGEALPDDDIYLARVAKLHWRAWARVKKHVMGLFFLEDGHWKHKRVEKEILKSCLRSAKAQLGGYSRAARRLLVTIEEEERKKESSIDDTLSKKLSIGASASKRSADGTQKEGVGKEGEEAFERFWTAYPKRAGSNPKLPARQKWVAALKAGADPEVLILAAAEYGRQESTLGHLGTPYIAQAVTWLHQRRWEGYKAPEKSENSSKNQCFIEVGTLQWSAWDDHYRKTKGRSPPQTDAKNGGEHYKRGWWFEAEWPGKEPAQNGHFEG